MEHGCFWPKNDGEKWSRKNIFEIPPCSHHIIFIAEFLLLIKTQPSYDVKSLNKKWLVRGEEFQNTVAAHLRAAIGLRASFYHHF